MENQEPSAGVVLNQRGRPVQQPRRRRRVMRRHLQGNGSATATTTTTSVPASSSSSSSSVVATAAAASSQATTGKRLAKRSIIGTRVCAPGDDGKYYSGAISAVNTPASPQQPELAGLSITPNTRYSVRFDPVPQGSKAPDSKTEYMDIDLIGPGFGSVTTAKLVPEQRVYLTYNGREIQAEVLEHREHNDEVMVVCTPPGQEGTITLTKRIDEVRLLESRKSARLADTDTDFARLADMGSDRKRGSTHTIEMPPLYPSRKRRTSSNSDSNYNWVEMPRQPPIVESPPTITGGNVSSAGIRRPCGHISDRENCMDECSAAMVLMSLSTPPKNPLPFHCQHIFAPWEEQQEVNAQQHKPHHHRLARASPGVGGSSPSSASWRSGTPSPLLSDQGTWTGSSSSASNGCSAPGPSRETHNNTHRYAPYRGPNSRRGSPYDEGIVSDLENERHPRKKRCKDETSDECAVEETSSPCSPREPSPQIESATDNNEVAPGDAQPIIIYKCTWRVDGDHMNRCGEIGDTWEFVAEHVLREHLKGIKEHDNEEDFYIVDEILHPTCSPPTKSHWDMVRPRSEDPEYQEEIRLAAAMNNPIQNQVAAAINTHDIIIRDVFSIAQQGTPSKQFKPSPRPLQTYNNNVNVLTVSIGKMPSAPRRARGDTKKCRKVYGMEHKDLWCTQCRWKKACTRFND